MILFGRDKLPEVINLALGKKLLFAIIAIVIIVVICIAAGIIVLNNGDKDNGGTAEAHDYWYYIDYSDYASSTATNGWISGDGDNPSDALVQSLGAGNSEIDGNWIDSINGVAPIFTVSGESWYTWVWTGSQWNGDDTLGLGEPNATVFYIGITTFDEDNNYAAALDPNTTDISGDNHP